MADVDAARGDQAPAQDQRRERFDADAETPADRDRDQAGKQFDQRVLQRNGSLAGRALATERDVAEQRQVFDRADAMTAVAAARRRVGQVEALAALRLRLFEQLAAVAPPFALHHDRQSIDDDVEKAADRQPDDEQAGEKKGRYLFEQVEKLLEQ